MSAQFVGPEMTDAQEIESDAIVRYDLDDAVDSEHYPDGRHWRFDRPDVAATLYVVAGGRIVEVTQVYTQPDGTFARATRTSA